MPHGVEEREKHPSPDSAFSVAVAIAIANLEEPAADYSSSVVIIVVLVGSSLSSCWGQVLRPRNP